MIYLDWAATAIPKKEIISTSLKRSLDLFGNPSSMHSAGLSSKEILEKCRTQCADLLKCSSDTIFFTSGGSESNNTVLLSFLKKHLIGEIITTSIEHPSGMEPLLTLKNFGWKLKTINPGIDGIIPVKKILKSITDKTKLISIIYVHNETGVIQPLDMLVKQIREKELETGKKIHIHIDGVQALGKTSLELDSLDIDSCAFSGHKFGSPKGVGLLYLKKQREPLYRGGGQEKGIRPGTENLFGIISFTECLKESLLNLNKNSVYINNLMNILIAGVNKIGLSTIPKTRELSSREFVPNILSLTCPPLPGEVLARVLNSKGYMVSTGSACSSNKKSTTKGILSMGISEDEGFSSFRVSIGETTTEDEVNQFLIVLEESIKELNP